MNILQTIWQKWKQLGHFIGDVVGRLVLTLFYATIFLPFGLYTRLARDPLKIKHPQTVDWLKRPPAPVSLEQARKSY